ncbi:hypothetical protein DH2020_015998 [Rehmannia glutinosa]|uniref:DUF7054 domain-containing protein n=1 Tax=Rehmannia glutinosa TaxID=99300 RepID=A0ABR0WWU6_REHGL
MMRIRTIYVALRLRRNISNKNMLNKQQQQNNRILIAVNVFGSAGPIRIVVNGDDCAAGVIEAVLKIMVVALKPSEAIGSRGVRNFVMCKKQSKLQATKAKSVQVVDHKGSGWWAWLQKSLSLKILSCNKVVAHEC